MEDINYSSLPDPKKVDPAIAGKRVLVIEDQLDFRSLLKKMLRSMGFSKIDEAVCGEDAVYELKQKNYDIVLCDYNLGPGQNGQQVLEEARFREYITFSTVFIMCTADNNIETLMGTLEYQADDYLIKPFSRDILERKLTGWIKKKENLNQVDKALADKDFNKVIGLCNNLIERNLKSLSEAMKLKGELLVRTGNYAEAISFYDTVLLRGDLPWAQLGKGKALFLSGDYDKAQNIFEEIIMKNDKIMGAHDMLASLMEKKGQSKKAQEVLRDAVRISPKALSRVKALGNIAYKNGDLGEAEQSFREVIKQGKHSIMKSPTDYTVLAKVLVEKDEPEEGLTILKNAEQEFSDPGATVQICSAQVFACKKMNLDKEAGEAVQKAKIISSQLEGGLPIDASLDFARALYLTGNNDDGDSTIKQLVQNYQDNLDVMASVQGVYKELNREEQGKDVVRSARSEIVRLNNDGVRMVRSGDFRQAIEYFEKAAKRLPANKVINANAAHAMLLYMKKNGSSARMMKQTAKYLEEIKNADPHYGRLKELVPMYEDIERGRLSHAQVQG